MPENHWITFPQHEVIRWAAFLPAPRGNPEELIRFGARVADAGTRHAVWSAQRLPGGFDAAKESFETYLRGVVRARPRVPLPLDEPPGESLWAPARIAFYRGDEIVQEDVGDIGALLRTLRPEKRSYNRSTSPVTVRGLTVPVDQEKEVVVSIRLDTDIWFPRLIGMAEPETGEAMRTTYDNRALAEIHTPRLNAFLEDVHGAALAAGGRWEVWKPDGFGMDYAEQFDELGVIL